jgi:hypothetical protein
VRGRGITRKGYPTYSKVFTGEFRGKEIYFYRGDDRGYYFRLGQVPGIDARLAYILRGIVVEAYLHQIVPKPEDKMPGYIVTVYEDGDFEIKEGTRLFLREVDIYEIAQKLDIKELDDFADYISSALLGMRGRLK